MKKISNNLLRKTAGLFLTLALIVFTATIANSATYYLSIRAGCDNGYDASPAGGKVYNQSGIASGNELPVGCIVQYIYAGADGAINVPDSSGNVSGDDVLVSTEVVGNDSAWGAFTGQAGMFYHGITYINPSSSTPKVYVRVWNASSLSSATYYGDSSLLTPAYGSPAPIPNEVGIASFYTNSAKPSASPQTITLLTPNGGEYIKGGSSYNITWTSTGTMPLVKIQYSTNGGGSYTTIAATTENDGTYSWLVPATNKTSCYVKIFDASDSTPIDTSEASFIIDSTGPQISSTTPSNSSTDQAVTATISTLFSSDSSGIDAASLTATNLKVSGSSSGNHTTAPTYNSSTRTATFNQSGTFTRGETVTCTIEGGSSGVKDNAGNTMTASYTWSFTVIEAPTISNITWNTDSTENIFNQNHIYGTITISGSHFGDNPGDGNRDTTTNMVKIGNVVVPDIVDTGGDDGVQVYYWDNSAIICGIPSNEAGIFISAGIQTVEVTSAGYVSAHTSASTIEIKPMVYGVTPSIGKIGDTITIEGTAFGTSPSAVSVSFNGALKTPVSVNNTSLTVNVPVAATTGQLTVTVNGETSNLTYSDGKQVKFTVTSEAVVDTTPVISSIEWKTDNPDNIKNKNYVYGTIQINGSNFGSDPGDGARSSTKNSIKIGGVVVPDIVDTGGEDGIQVYSWNSTTIVCGVPLSNEAGTSFVVAGNNTVEVTVDNIPNVTTTAATIEIKPRIYGVSPWSGPIGSTVTIEGTAYGTSTSNLFVSFNGKVTHPASVNNTSLQVTVPPLATTGQLSIIVNGKTSNLNYDSGSQILFTVTSEASTDEVIIPPTGEANAPEIVGVTSSLDGLVSTAYTGQTIYIVGYHFGSSGEVTVDGIPAVETYWIDSGVYSVVCAAVPSGVSAGLVNVILTNPNGSDSSYLTVSRSSVYIDDFDGGTVGTWSSPATTSGYYTFDNGITPDNSSISTQGPTSEAAYAGARGMKVKYSYSDPTATIYGGGWGAILANTLNLSGMNNIKFYLKWDGSSNDYSVTLVDSDGTSVKAVMSSSGLSSSAFNAITIATSEFTYSSHTGEASDTIFNWSAVKQYNFIYDTKNTAANYQYIDSILATYVDQATPYLSVNSTGVGFSTYVGGTTTSPTSNTVTISNSSAGSGNMDYTVSCASSWVTLSSSSGTLAGGASSNLVIGINLANAPTTAGTYSATVEVAASSAQNSPQLITVTLTVRELSGSSPTITNISQNAAPAGTRITLTGVNFGESQGASSVSFTKDGAATVAKAISWSDGSITLEVPYTLSEGNYAVAVYKLTVAESINILSQSDAISFQVTAASTAGIATIWPNPFNPKNGETITIQYDAGTATNIGIYIYDSTARVSKHSIVTGVNQVIWDGKNSAGEIVGDGVYLVRVINEDSKTLIAKGKILVIKR